MEEKTTGKRLVAPQGGGKKKKTPYIIAGAVVAVLLAGYLGLCAVAGGDKVWPNTYVRGSVLSHSAENSSTVDVSGMTADQAAAVAGDALSALWRGQSIDFVRGVNNNTAKETVATLPADDLMEVDTGAMKAALTEGQNGAFLTRGGKYLARLVGGAQYLSAPLTYTQNGAGLIEETIASVARTLGADGNATTWTVDDTAVTFTKGRTGAQVNEEALRSGVADVLNGVGLTNQIDILVQEAPPAEPNFQAIRDGLYTEPADAYLDRESGEIVESVTGKDLDMDAARLALIATAEGKSCKVPLALTEPALTTENLTEILFRDILGEAVTYVSGTTDRIQNVRHAAEFLNGTVVFPGEEFSFNQTCSPYTVDNGYGKATAYVNGLSKDTVAGGICQASSTLYWATLKANLETVERNAHRYEPSYIKGGLDATVYGDYGEEGGLDFRFINNTDHPIQLEGYMDNNRYLHMTIKGTDTTGIHGEPYSTNRVVTKAYETVYQADANVPQGVIKKDPERTGYTGVNIDTYQKLVDNQGKTVSETKLYTSKYKVRNEVLLYNPADAELWGIDPATGIRTEPVIAVESEMPAETTPVTTEEPVVTQTPAETTPVSEPTEEPDLPPWVEPTPAPVEPTSEPVPVETADSGETDPGALTPGTLEGGETP